MGYEEPERGYDEDGRCHQDVDLENADGEGVTDDRFGNTRYRWSTKR